MGNAASQETQTSKGGKIVGTIINILLIVAIIFAFVCTYTAFVTKSGNGVPSLFGIEPFSVQTDSMSPFFEAGDLVIDKKVDDPSTLQEGDVITFWTIIDGERVLNTHRIVGIEDAGTYRYFITKGDNNNVEDALTVHQSEVVGKYVRHIKKLGSVLDFLQTSKGFFCVIVLPVLAFFLYYLVNFFRVLFAYQAAKNKLQFEQELLEKNTAQNAVGAAAQPEQSEDAAKQTETENSDGSITLTREELEALLQKAVQAGKDSE